ncbi:MAG: tape measure protein [Dysgonomonas sp.]
MADGRDYFRASIDTSQFDRDAAHIENRFRGIGNVAEQEGFHIENALRNIGRTALGVFGGIQLTGFIKDIVRVRSEFQNTEAMFKVFLGSADQAKTFMKEMQGYAFNNVFEFKDLTEQAAQLLAYGTEVQNVTSTIDKLSNVAAGVNKPLSQFVELYNKAKSRGKLNTEDIQQWSAMGDVVSYLADMLGKSREQVQSMVSEGKIGFTQIDQLLNNLTDSGGKFAGMMEEKMKTLGDSVGLLEDSITSMLNELGEKSQDYLRSGILFANDLVENYETIGKVILGLIATYGTYRAAIIALNVVQRIQGELALQNALAGRTLTTVQGLQALATRQLTVAQAAFNKTALANPYVLVGVAIVGLISAIWALHDATTTQEMAQERLNEITGEASNKKQELESETSKLTGIINSETKTIYDQITAYKKLQGMYADLLGKMDMQTFKAMSATEQQKLLNQAINDTSDADFEDRLANQESIIKNLEKEIKFTSESLSYQREGSTYYAYRLGQLDKQKKAEEIVLATLKQQKAEQEEIKKEAEFLKLPEEERRIILENQLVRLEEQKKFIEQQIPQIKGINDEWAKLNPIFRVLNSQLEEVLNKIQETKDKLTTNPEVKNKSFWEKQKKEATEARDAMDESLQGSKEWIALSKKIDQADKKLGIWNPKKTTDTSAKTLAQKQLEAKQWLIEKQKELDIEGIKFSLDAEQKALDIQKDSFEKKQKQNELNYRKELLSIREFELNKQREQKEVAERLFISDSKNKGKTFDFSKFDMSLLPESLRPEAIKQQVKELTNIAQETWEHADTQDYTDEKKRLKENIEEFQSYVDNYNSINEKFNKKKEELEKQRTSSNTEQTDRAIAELEYQREQEIEQINNQFASREETFNAWIDQLADLSLNKLLQLLEIAKQELEKAEKEFKETGKGGNELATTRAKVDTLTNKINQTQASTTPGARSIKEWQRLHKTLSDVNDSFEDIGKSLGGLAGDIIATAGQVTASTLSMIDGIVTLSNSASTATEGTAKAASESIKTVEKASVILAVISAALQIATKIASLFGADYSSYNKAKDAYESYIDVLDRVIDKQKELVETMTGENARNSYKYALSLIRAQESAARELGVKRLNSGASAGSHSIGVRTRKNMSNEGWQQVRNVLGSSFDKATEGRMTGLFDLSIEQLKELQERAPSFWAQLDGDVRNYLQQIIDTEAASEDLLNTYQESITQISYDSFRDNFLNALADMDSSAEDFADDFEKYLQRAMINSLLKEKFDDKIRALYDSFSNYGEAGFGEDGYEQLQNQKDELVNEMLAEREKLKELLNWESSGSSQTPSSGGFETMTQNQAGALEGRFAGLQMTGISIDNSLKTLIVLKMESIQLLKNFGVHFQEMRNIGLQSMGYLEEIAKYTKVLPAMANDISEVKRNTSNL